MSNILNNVENDFTGAYKYTKHKVDNPNRTWKELKKTGRDAWKDVEHTGENVYDYTKDRVLHPSHALNDIRDFSTNILDDLVKDGTHRLFVVAGVLYFILSYPDFRNVFDKLIKSIPLVKNLYIFPHLASTALYLFLLYIVKWKLDVDINKGLQSFSNLIRRKQNEMSTANVPGPAAANVPGFIKGVPNPNNQDSEAPYYKLNRQMPIGYA